MIYPIGTRMLAIAHINEKNKYLRAYGTGTYQGRKVPPFNFYMHNMPFSLFEEGLIKQAKESGVEVNVQKSLEDRFSEHVIYLDNGMEVFGYECVILGPEKEMLERFAGYLIDGVDIGRQRHQEMLERLRKQKEQEERDRQK